MSGEKRIRVVYNGEGTRVTILPTWDKEAFLEYLRSELDISADLDLRLYIDDEGDEKGDRITNLRELGAVKQLLLKTIPKPHAASPTPSSATLTTSAAPSPISHTVSAPAGPHHDDAAAPPPEDADSVKAARWLSKFVKNDDTKREIENWRGALPEEEEEKEGDLASEALDQVTKIAPFLDNVHSVADTLTSLGVGLGAFGSMINMPPFTVAFSAIGKLCEIVETVQFNQENCYRIRRRATVIFPVLTSVWRRIHDDMENPLNEPTKAQIAHIGACLQELIKQVESYADAGWFSKFLTSKTFKENVEKLQADMDADLAELQRLLQASAGEVQAEHTKKLDALITASKSITVDVNEKLDQLLETSERTLTGVDELKVKLRDVGKELMTALLEGRRDDLIIPGVTSVKEVTRMIMAGDDRGLFVRDKGFLGPAPVTLPGGPAGHHYSADFRHEMGLLSIRFTERADHRWVFDLNHSRQREKDGMLHVGKKDGPKTSTYNPAERGYASMEDLLFDVFEIKLALGFDGHSVYCS